MAHLCDLKGPLGGPTRKKMSPLGSSVLGAENTFVQRKRFLFLFSRLTQPLSKKHDWLVSHELDFSTHLPLGLMLIYPAQMHNFPSSSSAFPPHLICSIYIYLSVFHLNTPSVLHLRSYAFAAPFEKSLSLHILITHLGSVQISLLKEAYDFYINITHHYFLLPYAPTFFPSY